MPLQFSVNKSDPFSRVNNKQPIKPTTPTNVKKADPSREQLKKKILESLEPDTTIDQCQIVIPSAKLAEELEFDIFEYSGKNSKDKMYREKGNSIVNKIKGNTNALYRRALKTNMINTKDFVKGGEKLEECIATLKKANTSPATDDMSKSIGKKPIVKMQMPPKIKIPANMNITAEFNTENVNTEDKNNYNNQDNQDQSQGKEKEEKVNNEEITGINADITETIVTDNNMTEGLQTENNDEFTNNNMKTESNILSEERTNENNQGMSMDMGMNMNMNMNMGMNMGMNINNGLSDDNYMSNKTEEDTTSNENNTNPLNPQEISEPIMKHEDSPLKPSTEKTIQKNENAPKQMPPLMNMNKPQVQAQEKAQGQTPAQQIKKEFKPMPKLQLTKPMIAIKKPTANPFANNIENATGNVSNANVITNPSTEEPNQVPVLTNNQISDLPIDNQTDKNQETPKKTLNSYMSHKVISQTDTVMKDPSYDNLDHNDDNRNPTPLPYSRPLTPGNLTPTHKNSTDATEKLDMLRKINMHNKNKFSQGGIYNNPNMSMQLDRSNLSIFEREKELSNLNTKDNASVLSSISNCLPNKYEKDHMNMPISITNYDANKYNQSIQPESNIMRNQTQVSENANPNVKPSNTADHSHSPYKGIINNIVKIQENIEYNPSQLLNKPSASKTNDAGMTEKLNSMREELRIARDDKLNAENELFITKSKNELYEVELKELREGMTEIKKKLSSTNEESYKLEQNRLISDIAIKEKEIELLTNESIKLKEQLSTVKTHIDSIIDENKQFRYESESMLSKCSKDLERLQYNMNTKLNYGEYKNNDNDNDHDNEIQNQQQQQHMISQKSQELNKNKGVNSYRNNKSPVKENTNNKPDIYLSHQINNQIKNSTEDNFSSNFITENKDGNNEYQDEDINVPSNTNMNIPDEEEDNLQDHQYLDNQIIDKSKQSATNPFYEETGNHEENAFNYDFYNKNNNYDQHNESNNERKDLNPESGSTQNDMDRMNEEHENQEAERQQELEREAERQSEFERQQELEREAERQAEFERQCELEREAEKQSEFERQCELEREAEKERQYEIEREAETEAEKEKQFEIERNAERERQIELERDNKMNMFPKKPIKAPISSCTSASQAFNRPPPKMNIPMPKQNKETLSSSIFDDHANANTNSNSNVFNFFDNKSTTQESNIFDNITAKPNNPNSAKNQPYQTNKTSNNKPVPVSMTKPMTHNVNNSIEFNSNDNANIFDSFAPSQSQSHQPANQPKPHNLNGMRRVVPNKPNHSIPKPMQTKPTMNPNPNANSLFD